MRRGDGAGERPRSDLKDMHRQRKSKEKKTITVEEFLSFPSNKGGFFFWYGALLFVFASLRLLFFPLSRRFF